VGPFFKIRKSVFDSVLFPSGDERRGYDKTTPFLFLPRNILAISFLFMDRPYFKVLWDWKLLPGLQMRPTDSEPVCFPLLQSVPDFFLSGFEEHHRNFSHSFLIPGFKFLSKFADIMIIMIFGIFHITSKQFTLFPKNKLIRVYKESGTLHLSADTFERTTDADKRRYSMTSAICNLIVSRNRSQIRVYHFSALLLKK